MEVVSLCSAGGGRAVGSSDAPLRVIEEKLLPAGLRRSVFLNELVHAGRHAT